MLKEVKLKGTESAWGVIEVIMTQRYEVSVRSKKINRPIYSMVITINCKVIVFLGMIRGNFKYS